MLLLYDAWAWSSYTLFFLPIMELHIRTPCLVSEICRECGLSCGRAECRVGTEMELHSSSAVRPRAFVNKPTKFQRIEF